MLLRTYQLRIDRTDWQIDTLPIHLRMRYLLVDETGKPLAESRVFDELGLVQQQLDQTPSTANATTLPQEREITARDLDTVITSYSIHYTKLYEATPPLIANSIWPY